MASDTCSENFGESPIVTIHVGPEKKAYRYHKILLCKSAPFFATSLKNHWNGKTLEIELSDVETDTFEVVMNWIYQFSRPGYLSPTTDMVAIAKLYKFVDYLMMEQEKNDLMDWLVSVLAELRDVTFGELEAIYALGLSSTKIFSLALRNCVRHFVKNPSQYKGCHVSHTYQDIKDRVLLTQILDCIRDYHLNNWENPVVTNCDEHHDHVNTSQCILSKAFSATFPPRSRAQPRNPFDFFCRRSSDKQSFSFNSGSSPGNFSDAPSFSFGQSGSRGGFTRQGGSWV